MMNRGLGGMRNTITSILIALILTIGQAATCTAEAREQVVAGPGSSDAPTSPDSGSPSGSPPPEWLADLMMCAVCEANPPGGLYWSCEYFCMHSAADFLNKCNQAGRTCYSIGLYPPKGKFGHQVNLVEEPQGVCRFVDTTSGKIKIGDITFPCSNPPEKAICQIMGHPDKCGWRSRSPSTTPEAPWTERLCSQRHSSLPRCVSCCADHAEKFYQDGARDWDAVEQPVGPDGGEVDENAIKNWIKNLDPNDIIGQQVDMTAKWHGRCLDACSSKFQQPIEKDPGTRFAIDACIPRPNTPPDPKYPASGEQCRECCYLGAKFPSYPPSSEASCMAHCNTVYGPPERTTPRRRSRRG
jgi:hypothetical protein